MKGKKKRLGVVLLLVVTLIILQLPLSEADAASSASDFKMEGSKLLKYRGTEKNVSIPDTVEIIGESAFEENDDIELIVVPKTVKRIEKHAFWGCDQLEEVVLGSGLTEVGDYAFTNCKGLKQIMIPTNIHSIGLQAFADCVNLRVASIPTTVTSIAESAFDGCAQVVMKCETGSYAEKYAKQFYEKQKEMPEYEDVPQYTVATETEEEEEEEIQDEFYPEEEGIVLGCTQIVGNQAVVFMDNTSEIVYDGPALQETIDGNQTDNNDGSISIPKYTLVDGVLVADQAYYRNQNLNKVIIPDGVNEIGQFSFARSSVSEIIIPDGTKKIGYGAFYHCDKLEKVVLPQTIEVVEPKAFTHSKWIEEFYQNGTEDFLVCGNVLMAYRGTDENVIIPDNVSVIASEAFADNITITEVVFPDSLRVVGEAAFEGCTHLSEIQWNLGLEKVKDRAFWGCPLEKTIMPITMQELGLKVFNPTVDIAFKGDVKPFDTHELSAERLSNEKYRELSHSSNRDGVQIKGMKGWHAELEGATRNYTLEVKQSKDYNLMERAFQRIYHKKIQDPFILYEMSFYDESKIPLTKLGRQNLIVTIPLPKELKNQEVRVVTVDRNGQLEEVLSEQVVQDEKEVLQIKIRRPVWIGIYCEASNY